MTTLTVTARGEVRIQGEVLQHLGVQPGEEVTVDLLPGGRAELRATMRAEQPKRSWHDMAGFLDGKTNGARLTIEDINEAIAESGAAAGLGEA